MMWFDFDLNGHTRVHFTARMDRIRKVSSHAFIEYDLIRNQNMSHFGIYMRIRKKFCTYGISLIKLSVIGLIFK